MSVQVFANELSDALAREHLPAGLLDERDFERRFIIPVATQIVSHHRDVLLYAHPWRSKICCTPGCVERAPAGDGRVVGCPKCWRRSKHLASVAAFGMHHTFDVVARDPDSSTLALEAKLSGTTDKSVPTGAFQRLVGQCSLAATKHDLVIGVFAYRGRLREKWHRDTDAVTNALAPRIRLVLRPAD